MGCVVVDMMVGWKQKKLCTTELYKKNEGKLQCMIGEMVIDQKSPDRLEKKND